MADGFGEPLFATAPVARAWILIQQRRPWPRQAPALDLVVGAHLAGRAKASSVKVLAVDRRVPTGTGRRVFIAADRPGGSWMESAVIDDDRALLGLDLPALADGQRPGLGELDAEALYLVCTHGARDACCGIRGRPLAEALARLRPGRVWECSHLGGHRFASNVVCLPAGLVYGRVPPEGAAALVRAHERGEVTLDHLRGRSFHPPAVQAAEHFLRQALGVMGIDAVEPIGVSDRGAGAVDVRLCTAAGRWRVQVRAAPTGRARALSCGSDEAEDPDSFELMALVAEGRGMASGGPCRTDTG